MLNVLDLFSGIGGFSLGLERTGGFQTVAFCEIDRYRRAVLAKHWPHVPIYEDVRKLDYMHWPTPDHPDVDVICGGFPCQDISVAGKGAGIDGERSGLWGEYARLIGELRPSYAIVENVAALLVRGLGRVLGDLAEIGYDAEWQVISAADVGAPHLRARIWIVAYPEFVNGGRERRVPVLTRLQGWLSAADGRQGIQPGDREACSTHLESRSEAMADTESGVRQRTPQRTNGHVAQPSEGFPNSDREPQGWPSVAWRERGQWLVEPDVGRVAHGIPARMDRLSALGDAVVPQIPALIGRAILEAEGE